MPAIIPPPRRRKGPTPITRHSIENGNDNFLDIYGLEKLNARQSRITSNMAGPSSESQGNAVDADASSASGNGDRQPTKKEKVELVNLPEEIQKQIFGFARHPELIALSLVSRHMRDIAASLLYRSFHIVFPDDDDPANDYPIDSLASGLDTFVTSDYNYATYLREITLEALSTGVKGELAYRHYLLDASCGKFMNTLLLLTLRKAKALETFKWDIRVELSREVFKALHQIQSLQNLHLRMQAGTSIHQVPPPLPNPSSSWSTPPSPYLPSPPPLPHHNAIVFIQPLPVSYATSPSITTKSSTKNLSKTAKSQMHETKPPTTISNFRRLKSLSILDMDTHDYLDEIRACLENSSSTLNVLRLSYSEILANKSRKPPPEMHSDDESDIEDDFGQILPASGVVIDPAAPSKALKAQEEKKSQEAALGKIFGVETASKSKVDQSTADSKDGKIKDDRTTKSIKSFVTFFTRFMSQVKPGREDTEEAKEAKEMIEKATRMYLDIQRKEKTGEGPSMGTGGTATPSSTASNLDLSAVIATEVARGIDEEESSMEHGLFDNTEARSKETTPEIGMSRPEDIDIEAPEEEILEIGTQQESTTLEPISSELDKSPLPTPPDEVALESSSTTLTEQEKQVLQELDEALVKPATKREAGNVDWLQGAKTAIEERKKSQYIRKTRGLTLKTLALYLIPVKASVLNKAIDFSVLQDITLLSVGSQNNIWNHLEKENKDAPLPLRRIHTDNVTLPFLNLVSQLKKLEELYMVERKPRRGIENTTAKTVVTSDNIRKAVLKKHAKALKVLVIRNDCGDSWDLDVKSVMLLCQSADKLEELTVGFADKALHTFLQFMHGLTAVKAIHILVFRYQDNCEFSRSELPKLIIDNVSNHPALKLEYLAVIDMVHRLVRRKLVVPKLKSAKEIKARAREKAAKKAKEQLTTELFQTISTSVSSSTPTPDYEWQESSEDEVENQYGRNGLRLETFLLRTCDVIGVKIFEKEVISNSL